jgi:SulP family sulfate permease
MKYLRREEVSAGAMLARQGDSSTEMFFVAAGLVSIQLALKDGEVVRLRTARPGAIVGEVSTYLGIPRSAHIVAEAPSTVYCLSADNLRRMQLEMPELAASFHRFIVHLLANRLADTTEALQAALD